METLIAALKGLLADAVVLKFRAHGYHWNVEGKDFSEYHDFFGTIYSDVDGSIDPIAENIRKLGDYAPFRLDRLIELASLQDTDITSDAQDMTRDLLQANESFTNRLMSAFEVANDSNQQGIANFLAERIDAHQKWSWQLRASLHA